MDALAGEKTVVRVDFQKGALTPEVPDPEKAQGTWGAVRRRLQGAHPALFDNWFAKLAQEHCAPHSLTLRAPNGFTSRYIETHFADILAEAVDAEMPTPDRQPRKITLIS